MDYKNFIQNVIESYLEHLSKKAIFLKHYNTRDITLRDMIEKVNSNNMYCFLFHEYSLNDMKGAYEPFLSWTKVCYETFYSEIYSVEEFVDRCEVYSLHKGIIAEYIKTGLCIGNEELMVEEMKYEQHRMLMSMYSVYKYVAREHPIIIVISKLHMAPDSTLRLINTMFNEKDDIHFIFTYNDMFYIKDYMQKEWNTLIASADNGNMILEWGMVGAQQSMDLEDEFFYHENRIREYLIKLNNMYYMYTFEDAADYLEIIYDKINRVDSYISAEDKIKISALYALSNIGLGNSNQALLICENMSSLIEQVDSLYYAYAYNYISAMAHLIRIESRLTSKFCKKCRTIAIKMKDELLEYKADMLECISDFGGFREIFKCNYNYQINNEILEKTIRFGYQNFLAYLYIFGFDNDEESIIKIAKGKKEPVYFNKGIEIAEKIGNNNLLLMGYMKNIITYSEYGFHQYVRSMYEKRIEVPGNISEIRKSHMYGGLGYNYTVLGEYRKADESLRKSIEILLDTEEAEDMAEMLYNMGVNYFVCGINDKSIECMECVIKIIDIIGIQGIRICNTSKLYGMIALANYKLGQYYNCYCYLDKLERMLSHLINNEDSAEYKHWEEDLFLYHLIKALMYVYERSYGNADKEFDNAFRYMNMLKGTKYYSYAEYIKMRAGVYKELGRGAERKALLSEGIEFCIEEGHIFKMKELRAELNNEEFKFDKSFAEEQIPFDRIIHMAHYVGNKIKLKNREIDINFLIVCQEMFIKEQISNADVINNFLNTIQTSFNLDQMLLLGNKSTDSSLDYDYFDKKYTEKEIKEIFEFFDSYKKEFLANRTDKNFAQFMPIIDLFGKDKIVTIIGIPVIRDGKVVRVFLATVDMHRNFTANRKFLSNSNLLTMKVAVEQLDEALKRNDNSSMIRQMNEKLEKAAITDRLTGIYNRFGFEKIIDEKASSKGVVLYMDIDNFKHYNDTFGHNVGDDILVKFSKIIADRAIKCDGYAIRYGGDEFVIFIPDKTEKDAENVAADILHNMNEKLKKELHDEILKDITIEKEKEITCSIGISEYDTTNNAGITIALKQADEVLYTIKNKGKGEYAVWSKFLMQ